MTDPDPHAGVTVGSTPSHHPRYNDILTGFWTGSRYVICARRGPSTGRQCTRPAGHSWEWQHIASLRTSEGGVQEVWMETLEADPHWSLTTDMSSRDVPGFDHPVTGFFVGDRTQEWCRAVAPDRSGSVCSRASRHPAHWRHIAATRSRVICVWGGEELTSADDPEDGTAEDTVVATTPPTVGQVMRLRNRANRLYVMKVRISGDVEALDFTRDELRVLPLDRCIALTEDAMLTMDEIAQVGRWYHQHRETVRKVAVREYRRDRWCLSGLNGELRNLGLENYEPSLHGTLTLTVPFDCPNIHAVTSEVEAEVRAAVLAQEAALRAAMPSVTGMELDVSALKVQASDLTRK